MEVPKEDMQDSKPQRWTLGPSLAAASAVRTGCCSLHTHMQASAPPNSCTRSSAHTFSAYPHTARRTHVYSLFTFYFVSVEARVAAAADASEKLMLLLSARSNVVKDSVGWKIKTAPGADFDRVGLVCLDLAPSLLRTLALLCPSPLPAYCL